MAVLNSLLNSNKNIKLDASAQKKNKKTSLALTQKVSINETKSKLHAKPLSPLNRELKVQNQLLKDFRFLERTRLNLDNKQSDYYKLGYRYRKSVLKKVKNIRQQHRPLNIFMHMLRIMTNKVVFIRQLYFSKIGFIYGRPTIVDHFYLQFKRPYRWVKALDILFKFYPLNYFNIPYPKPYIYGSQTIKGQKPYKFPALFTNFDFIAQFFKTKHCLYIAPNKFLYITGKKLFQSLGYKIPALQSRPKTNFTFRYRFFEYISTRLKNISQSKQKNKVKKKACFIKKYKKSKYRKEYTFKKNFYLRLNIITFFKPYSFRVSPAYFYEVRFLYNMFPYHEVSKKRRLIIRRSLKFPINHLVVKYLPAFFFSRFFSIFFFYNSSKFRK